MRRDYAKCCEACKNGRSLTLAGVRHEPFPTIGTLQVIPIDMRFLFARSTRTPLPAPSGAAEFFPQCIPRQRFEGIYGVEGKMLHPWGWDLAGLEPVSRS